MATTINIFIFALFEKERSLEVRALFYSFFLSKIVPRTLLLALAYVVLPRIKEKKRKISVVCGILHGFLAESWKVLDSSWLFATTSCLFLTDFFFPRIGKSTQESSRSKQEDIKKLLRRRQEAPRHVKNCHEVSKRRRSVKNIFENFKKNLGPSRSIKNTEEVLRSYQEVSKKSLRMIKNLSSARFLFKFVKMGQLLDGQPEFNRIINQN